jgi:hypothetical protein
MATSGLPSNTTNPNQPTKTIADAPHAALKTFVWAVQRTQSTHAISETITEEKAIQAVAHVGSDVLFNRDAKLYTLPSRQTEPEENLQFYRCSVDHQAKEEDNECHKEFPYGPPLHVFESPGEPYEALHCFVLCVMVFWRDVVATMNPWIRERGANAVCYTLCYFFMGHLVTTTYPIIVAWTLYCP